MSLEHEVKLQVPAEFSVPPLFDLCVVQRSATVEQTATYYDTPDLRLARAGASLQFRDDDGWTVKLPEGGDHERALVRREQTFGGSASAPPEAALELVASLVRTSRLVPAVRLRTIRHRASLHDPEGGPLGVLTDDECTVLDDPCARGFREIELELADGVEPAAVTPVVQRLRDAGALATEPVPKVVRALGERATAPPDVVVPPVTEPVTVDVVLRHAISESVARLIRHDPIARTGEDPEGVHQARVATRRLRSHLRAFASLLEPAWVEGLRHDLGWIGGILGAVRDADVLLERLRSRAGALPPTDQHAASVLLERVVAQRDGARRELLQGLRSPRYLALLDRLVDAAHRPRVLARLAQDPADTLRALVRRPWRRLRAAVRVLPDAPPDEALHAVRIRAKRARYAAEAVAPAFGRPARRLARALTALQDVLGEHQDAIVAEGWLRTAVADLDDPVVAFVAGELAATERAAADAARSAWPGAWRAASRRELTAFLDP